MHQGAIPYRPRRLWNIAGQFSPADAILVFRIGGEMRVSHSSSLKRLASAGKSAVCAFLVERRDKPACCKE
jgi:hypothetical protein